ncbi:hypothetical protein AB0F17_28570 [Nonomuraea sp. NPDC026600]|uniref:hypothetical protein n=1 Tax=Nonomuraea sp. NPDC026600 TaxID=3155363 RepID=UPI0033D47460
MRGTPDDETKDREGTGEHGGDELYTYVDLRDRTPDDDEADDDEPEPAVTRRRPAARRAAARKTSSRTPKAPAKKRGRARQGAEIAGGALLVMTLIGFGAYALAAHVLDLPRDAALVLGGLAAGLTPLGGRAFLAGRKRLGSWITPSGVRT